MFKRHLMIKFSMLKNDIVPVSEYITRPVGSLEEFRKICKELSIQGYEAIRVTTSRLDYGIYIVIAETSDGSREDLRVPFDNGRIRNWADKVLDNYRGRRVDFICTPVYESGRRLENEVVFFVKPSDRLPTPMHDTNHGISLSA